MSRPVTENACSPFPLTEAQEGLWYLQARDPLNPILNAGQYLELLGPLDRDVLIEAVARMIAESDALHLRFNATADGAMQSLSDRNIRCELVDLSDRSDAETRALAWMAEDSNRPVDPARDPLSRFALLVLDPERHFLYERIHHLAIDGYGMVLVTNRIAEHYAAMITSTAAPARFPPLSVAVQEDRDWRVSERRQKARDWWHETLKDLPEVTGPAAGRAVTRSTFHRESSWLSEPLRRRLAARAEALRLGWPDLLNALVGAYLARWTGGEAVIGLPFMARFGRPTAMVPCMAMNVLPQRITLDEDADLGDWLAGCAEAMRRARRHGLYRSEYLRRELNLIGGSRRLYGPLVNVQPFDKAPEFSGLDCRLHILGAGAVDDLTLTFRGDPASGMLFEVDANPDLYAPEDVAGHLVRLPDFLMAALEARRLAEVPTASPAEIAWTLALHRAAVHSLPETTLTALIERQMAQMPEAPALVFGDQRLSYGELDDRSAALAAQLQDMGAGPDRIVAVALERSLELPIALLAILRAGAGYLPLDADHPRDRLSRILDQAQVVTTLTSTDLETRLPARTGTLLTGDWAMSGQPRNLSGPDHLAYVIFTSGSTGEPKGVAVEHRAIVNRLLWMRAEYGIAACDRILQKTPATFDVSVWEFFLPLIAGATLVMAEPGAHRDPARLAAAIRDHGITTLHFVPSMLSAFLAAPASEGLSLSRVFCSGEELTADQRDRFHARIRAELHNLYGPTEAAVDVSFWPAQPDDRANPVPIGWPVWNTRLEVLDGRMRPVPPGLAGDLYLGGVQLARGYLGRVDLTADRFIPDPQRPGDRLYRTGDLARRRQDGAVVFLGRSDHQVKIRGLRIELGEIEAAIMATGLMREAVVIAREDQLGEKRLVAYAVPVAGYQPGTLAARLGERLPAYMIPSAEVLLASLPVTANGKLDRKALPAPSFTALGRAAHSESERILAGLYAEVLHLPEPAPVEADFFALGGDSLSAVRLILRIEEETGRDPGLGTVFEHPMLESMARAIEAGREDDGLGSLILLAGGDADAAPLFLIHPAGGLGWGYRHLARDLAPDRAIWAVQHPGLDPDEPLPGSLDLLARDYAARIAAQVPQGILHLAGWSVGGIIAQAMAVELAAMGRQVGMVAALDSYPADVWRAEPEPDPMAALRALLAIAGHDPEAHRDLDSRRKVMAFLREGDSALGALPGRVLDGVIRVVTDTNRLVRDHHHRPMQAGLTHIRAGRDHRDRDLGAALWTPYAGEVDGAELPCLHAEIVSPRVSALIAPILRRAMARVESGGGEGQGEVQRARQGLDMSESGQDMDLRRQPRA